MGSKRGRGLRGALVGVCALIASLAVVPGAAATSYVQAGAVGIGVGKPGGVAIDQSNGRLYIAEFTPISPGVGFIARFGPNEAGELTPLEPATMGAGFFAGVAVNHQNHNVYGNTVIAGQAIHGFDGNGSALGAPFPIVLGPGTTGQPAISGPGGILLPWSGPQRVVAEYDPATGSALQTLTCASCTAPSAFGAPTSVATDSTGNIYVADSGGQVNDLQTVDLTGVSAGSFNLTLDGETTGAEGTGGLGSGSATGTGDLSSGSPTVANLVTTTGAFEVGQGITGTGIPSNTYITAVGAGTLTLSSPASSDQTVTGLTTNTKMVFDVNTSSGAFISGAAISGAGIPAGTTISAVSSDTLTLSANATTGGTGVVLTSAIAYASNAVNNIANALGALASVGGPSNLKVTRSGSLYTVEFKGSLAATDVPQMTSDGSGLTPPDNPPIATIAVGGDYPSRLIKFGPEGDADPTAPVEFGSGNAAGVTVNLANDHVFVSADDGEGWRVTEYDPSGLEISDFGLGALQVGLPGVAPQIAVNESTGTVYISDVTQDQSNGYVIIFTPVPSPSATTDPATAIASNEATLNGTVNPNGVATLECSFQYVVEAAFEAEGFTGAEEAPCVPEPGEAAEDVEVSAEVEGLSPQTTYVYRVVEETEGGTAEGEAEEFTTLPPKPKATTEAASGVSETAATLNASVDAEGDDADCSFEYGTSAAYGTTLPCSTDPVTGSSPTAVSAAIAGLAPGTTYHYRVVAENEGGTTNGDDTTLTTASPPPPPPPPPPPTPAPAPTPPTTGGGGNAKAKAQCLKRAKAAHKKALKKAKRKKGKARAKAMKAANKRKAKQIAKCKGKRQAKQGKRHNKRGKRGR